jgi:serine/threonine protein phosphatase PrpC
MSTATAFRSATASDPGLARDRNEDRVYADDSRGVYLVVDGLGGHPAGDRAADIAVSTIPRELELATGDIERRIRQAIAAANNAIFEAAQSDPDCQGMACVLTLAVAEGDRVTVGHVGDSRLYLAWNGMVRKITSDHSPVGEREDSGEITESDAMAHPRRNEVFRDAGTQPHEPGDEGFIEVRSFAFHPDAAMLLCTDGLSDVLTSARISSIVELFDGDADRTAAALVEAANRAGGIDNVSVIFIPGPEFLGAQSPQMLQARERHAITRMRGRRWPRYWLSRFPWLLAGIAAGMAAWALMERYSPRPHPTPRIIYVQPGDPAALSKALGSAHPGDIIQLAPGRYTGPIDVPEGVTLNGPKSGRATLGANTPAPPPAASPSGARE